MTSRSSSACKRAAAQEPPGTCDVRLVESPAAAEWYITATPGAGTTRRQAEEMYDQIVGVLRESRARMVQERLFASADAISCALAVRAAALGDLDDGVEPTLLAPRCPEGQIVGAQVHAIRGIAGPGVLCSGGGRPQARAFECDGYRYLTGSGLCAPERDGGPDQTRLVFEKAEALLAQAGGTLLDIARTWVWMDDIHSWYGELNQARTRFFTERGLMGASGRLPASTGIGVSPSGGGRVALDFFAAWGREDAVARFPAAGNQRSACDYGSAFARCSLAKTPGGVTVFCSGTAAIDAAGHSCFLNDPQGQIRMAVDNVLAVLRDMGCSSDDVVQALAYGATPAVRDYFLANGRHEFPWPCLTMIGDICRADLLFEIEVTACPRARKP